MNWQHLRAFLWLHVRLRRNQMRRSGPAALITEAVISVMSVLVAGSMFLLGLLLGVLVLSKAPAALVMWVWDGYIVAFVFFWLTELLLQLQRGDILSFDKFLHLPMLPSGLFLINYIASFSCVSVNAFLPAMIGLSIGLVFSKGASMLVLFPVVIAFFVMVMAVTYQFRGWLASLMENKRRRRNIIAIATMVFVLITQLPSILVWTSRPGRQTETAIREETSKLDRLLAAHQIDPDEYKQRTDAIYKKYGTRRAQPGQARQDMLGMATTLNRFVPLGWPAYAAMNAVEATLLPSLLVTLGMGLIGTFSLIRSYRTTLRLYTGGFTSSHPAPRTAARETVRVSVALLEKRLPWISEHASAIAMCGLRSMTRAPEAKMMLLTPVSFVAIFGVIFRRVGSNPTEILRPLLASGAMVMTLLGMVQLAGNLFGLDRSGFRAFVLTPASRRDILLGKNLSLLPFAVGFGIVGAVVIQLMYPMPMDYFLAVVIQTVPMYLAFCIQHNFVSLLAPVALPPGSLRMGKPKGVAILFHLATLALFPVVTGATLIPLGVEFLFHSSRWPIYLSLALIEVLVVVYFYSRLVSVQGLLLQNREQKILEIVTAKTD